jgi:hypothetical protein
VKLTKNLVVPFLVAAGASLVVASLAMAWTNLIPEYESDLSGVCGSPASNNCAQGYWGGVYGSLGSYANASELYATRYSPEFAEYCSLSQNAGACYAWQEAYMPIIELWVYAGEQCTLLGGCGA